MTFFKNEVGRVIRPSPLGFDISAYTISVLFQRPAGTTITKSGTAVDNTTGQVSYTTTTSDTVLDTLGEWLMQVKLTTGGGSALYGPLENFYVEEKIA